MRSARGRRGPREGLAALVAVAVLATIASPAFGSTVATASSGTSLSPSAGHTPTPAPSTGPVEVAPGYTPAPGTSTLGPLSPADPLSVVVGLQPRDLAGLQAYVASEYLPGSALYHAYLTPHELAARFGPAAQTLGAAERYFSGFGLRTAASPDGLLLNLEGPSGAIGRAFGTSFERYLAPSGRPFVSHATPATLPGGIPWSGAYGLGNVTPFRPALAPGLTPQPVLGPATSCPPASFGLTPCVMQNAYSLDPLYTNGTNGTGVRIGVADAYDSAEPQTSLVADFHTFTTSFGLPTATLSFAYPVPTSANLNRTDANVAWGVEEALDIEWVHAIAPRASVLMAFSPDSGPGLITAVDWLVATNAVNIISLSWGEPFTGIFNAFAGPCSLACNASSDGTYTLMDPIFAAAAAEGISVFSATGDCGASDGTSGLSVNYPAADPYVTAVGGTLLRVSSSGSYVTESGWNGSSPGSIRPGCANQGGSGGGYSPIPRPSWQAGLPQPYLGRATPDVAADAANPALIVYQGTTTGVGGTSLSTPIWAGIAAIADQYARVSLGYLNPGLYRIYDSGSYPQDFHDILVGNNGYSAGPRWDPVTGIGTPIVSGLVQNLTATPESLGHGPGVLLYASPRYGRAPLTVTFALGLTGSHDIQGVNFGDGTSALGGTSYTHTYPAPGVYSAQGFAADAEANVSLSPPVAVVVGGGTALSVKLVASTLALAVGGSVVFGVTATGGKAPYLYNFSFGDGTYLNNQTGVNVTHAYRSGGGFCAEVVARDSARPLDGAASARLGISVGGSLAVSCGNDLTSVSLMPNPVPQVRDAPAEFPNLFQSSGGTTPPPGVSNSVQYLASDPYVHACQCAIFSTPGNYTVHAWENDTVSQGASAVTNVTVTPSLRATFDASVQSGPAPLAVTFTSTVGGGYGANAAAVRWTFGNGGGSTGATANATYTAPGEYVAIGAVSDLGHGNASEAFLIDVESTSGISGYGVVGTITPAVNIASGTTVRFTGSYLAPAGSGPVAFAWSLGPGFGSVGGDANQTYYAPLPAGTGDSLALSASVRNPSGANVYQMNFSLPSFFATESGGFVPRISTLVLATGVVPLIGPAPLLLRGTAVASGAGPLTGPNWTFGDGARLAGSAVNHTYAGLGLYTVTATTGDAFGHTATATYCVLVNPGLAVSGGPSDVDGIAPFTVTFSASASGGYGAPYTYHWAFQSAGAGVPPSGSGPTIERTFTEGGVFTVYLNVTDAAGILLVRTWSITVHSGLLNSDEVLEIALPAGIAIGLLAYLVALWRFEPDPGRLNP